MTAVSCGDNRQRDNLKPLCNTKSLELDNYRPKDFSPLTLPGGSNIDQISAGPVKDGSYVLQGSIIHIHDQNFKAPKSRSPKSDRYFQVSFGFNKVDSLAEEVDENIVNFETTVNCLYNLLKESAGKSIYQVNIPTTVSVFNKGQDILFNGMNTYEMGYYEDLMLRMKKMPSSTTKGPTDDSQDINPSDTTVVTNFYQNLSTKLKEETYQLQSRVTSGNVTITLVNNYTRCVHPTEIDGFNTKTVEEQTALNEAHEKCTTQSISLKELNN